MSGPHGPGASRCQRPCIPQCFAESGAQLMVAQPAKYPIMHYTYACANAKKARAAE